MKNILITGGSGLIGKALTKHLESEGKSVAWLSRSPDKQPQKCYEWNIKEGYIDEAALAWADAIIHLAGASVADERWTAERKELIIKSRTESAELIFQKLKNLDSRPRVFVSASGSNYYGLDNGAKWLNEEDPAGDDFLSEVVVAWENAGKKIASLGLRTVFLRTGVVLDAAGGALSQMLQPPVAAPLGSGNQYMSWIHIEDLARMYAHSLKNGHVSGIYNAVAPHPATNKHLTKTAAKQKGKPYLGIPVPGFILRIALGEMAGMILGSNKISCDKMLSAGFKFKYATVEHALKEIYGNAS